MDALRIGEHADTKAKELSGGTKRKVHNSVYLSMVLFWLGIRAEENTKRMLEGQLEFIFGKLYTRGGT